MIRPNRPFDILTIARALRGGAGLTGECAEAMADALAEREEGVTHSNG